jgi:hypothetical protein
MGLFAKLQSQGGEGANLGGVTLRYPTKTHGKWGFPIIIKGI